MDWGSYTARVLAMFQPRQTIEARNVWNLYADIAWFGILSGVSASFLSVYTIRLGGSDSQVGLLSALPALTAILASIPGSLLVEGERKPLSVLVITAVLNRVGYLALAFVPFLPAIYHADAIVALIALLTIPGAMANVAFTTMFGRAVSPDQRARVVSIRNVWIGITSTAAALLGGKFLDLVQFPINYQILFALAFVASMLSAYHLTRLRLPAEAATPAVPAPRAARGLREFVEMFRASRQYTRFTFVSFVFHWGLFFPAPLYSIYWVRNLHATEGWVGLFNMIGSATTIVFYPLWGRIAARHGNQPLMFISTLGLALYPFLTACAPSPEWIILPSLLGGIVVPAFGLAFFNGLLEVCPEQNRASHIAVYNTLINVAAFLSPILSTSLTGLFGVPALLLVGGGLRLAGALLIGQQRALDRNVASGR